MPERAGRPDSGPPAASWPGTALVAAFAFLFATARIHDFDTWWHLRTGEWILQNRGVPRVDPFSFTAEGTPWIAHYWLSDVLFASVNRAFGVSGLILLCAAVVAAAFAIVHRLMVRRGVDPFLAALLLGIAVVAARFRFMVRPQVFMFLFAAIFLSILCTDLRRHPRRLLWLLPVMLLWVNMHASFVLALVFTGGLFVDRLLAWAVERRGDGPRPEPLPMWIGATLLGLTALTLASPYGADLPAWVLRDFTSHAVTRSFQLEEHAALAWGSHPLVWALMLATIGSFALAGREGRLFDGLVAAALAVLALRSQRFAALASIVFALVIGANLAVGLARRLRAAPERAWTPRAAVAASVALAAAGLLAFEATYTPDKVYRFGLGVMESRIPVAAVSFLEDLDVRGNVLNTWEFGGYLLWRLPELRTFADGRTLDAHMEAVAGTRAMTAPELDGYARQDDIGLVVVRRGDEPYATFAASSTLFRLVFFDDQAAVYLRQDRYERLAADGRVEAFRWIRPERWDTDYLVVLAGGHEAAAVERELRRAVALSPTSFQPLFLLGTFLEAQGRPEALDALEAAAEANPSLAFTHYGVGLRAGRFALHLQEWDRAAEIARRSLAFGASGESWFVLGTAAQMTGRLDEAEQAFERALDEDPGNANTLVNLGFVYLDSGRPRQAVQAFSAAVQAAPGNESALYGLALSSQRNGAERQASELWLRFLGRFPESRWAANARRFLAEAERAPGA